MAYFDCRQALVNEFKGSAQASDPYGSDIAHGLYCQNTDFLLGPDGQPQAGSRRGTSQITQISAGDGAIRSLASWYFNNAGTQDCWAVYYAPAVGVRAWKQASSALATLIATTGAAYSSFAPDGLRGYFAFGNSTGRYGTASGAIYNAAAGNTDNLFPPPLSTTVVTVGVNTTAGAGVVTAGLHRVGLLYTSRNGAYGVCPVNASKVFTPTDATAPDGTHSWTVTATFASIPSYMVGGTVQVVMSSVANPAAYYAVAGAVGNVPGAPGAVAITVNISDIDLVEGTDVTLYQTLLTSALAGTPPFLPSALFTYSSRMGYVALDAAGLPVVYISNPNAFQILNAGLNAIYLEGKQIPVQGTSLDQTCYIASLSGLYSCSDNGGDPVTWTPPARVDGSVGILAPSCILASAGRILLASEKGLFAFRGGAFPDVPLSYWQAPDWSRINWAAPTQVQVVDDALDRVIRVIAPLKVLVTGASNTSPISITTGVQVGSQVVAYPHLLQTGMSVTITGVAGNTAANTTATITVTSATTFTIAVAGNGAYTSGGVVTPAGPNAELSWNYSLGETPAEVMYSLNAFSEYRQGAIGSIRNLSTGFDEVWYAPAASNPGGLLRRVLQQDTLIHRDINLSGSASAISWLYETGVLPGEAASEAIQNDFQGFHFRGTGSGNLLMVVYGLDHTRSVTPARSPLALSTAPGQEILVKFFLRAAQASISIGTNAVDAFGAMALIRMYWLPSVPFT